MASMEQNSPLDALNRISDRLRKRYTMQTVGKNECFCTSTGVFFMPFSFPEWNALAIEYAENRVEAEKGRFEDGDLFYIGEMSEDEMFAAMIAEIEG